MLQYLDTKNTFAIDINTNQNYQLYQQNQMTHNALQSTHQ